MATMYCGILRDDGKDQGVAILSQRRDEVLATAREREGGGAVDDLADAGVPRLLEVSTR